jgi:pilus assembly protein Flp/PilA
MVDSLTPVSVRLRRHDERGATATEYAILVGFMVFAMILGLTVFGNALSSQFSAMSSVIAGFN